MTGMTYATNLKLVADVSNTYVLPKKTSYQYFRNMDVINKVYVLLSNLYKELYKEE
jgi:hypothetical protein